MSNTPHTLHDEFPAEAAKISALKVKDAHFAKLLVAAEIHPGNASRTYLELERE